MRHLLTLLLVACTLPAQTLRTVCATGCSYALTQLQQAVDDAAAGDVIQIEAGQTATISGGIGLILRNKNITDGPHITIRSSGVSNLGPGQRVTPADSGFLAKITIAFGPFSVITNEKGAGYYRFHGIEITAPSNFPGDLVEFGTRTPNVSYVADHEVKDLAHDIVFDQCYFHGDPASIDGPRRAIRSNLASMVVMNSWIENIKNRNSESNAIGGWNGKGPFYVRNNHLEAVAITTLLGGAQPNIRGLRADGTWFIGNHYYRSWKYRVRYHSGAPSGTCLYDEAGGEYYKDTASDSNYQCVNGGWVGISSAEMSPYYWQKNVFELKNSWRSWVEGNYFENAWNPATQNQFGAMFLFNLVDNDPPAGTAEPAATVGYVDIRNNYGRRTAWVSSLGSIGGPYYLMHNNITMDNNVFDEIGDSPWTLPAAETFGSKWGGNYMSMPGNATRIRYSHNTFNSNAPVEARVMYLYGTAAASRPDQAMIYGNIVPWNKFGFYNDTGGGNLWNSILDGLGANRIFTRNVVANNQGLSIYGRPSPIVNLAWNPDVPTLLACSEQNCGFPNAMDNGGSDDVGFVNYAARNYRLAANSRYKRWAPFGQDPGADVDQVEWSTTTTPSGAPNQYLDFQVRTVAPDRNTFRLRYTAYDTAPCSTAISTRADMSSAVTTSDSGGDMDREVVVNSLSPNTRYFWQLTCGSAGYRRSGIVLTKP